MSLKDKVILSHVKAWLKEEVESQQDVVDAKDNGEDWATSDGTDDIIIGRHECASSCLERIKRRETELPELKEGGKL